jgi:hypothetical protein
MYQYPKGWREMFKAWHAAAPDGQSLARLVEAHLNEHASEVVSVSYVITDQHYALTVYRPLDGATDDMHAAAVEMAEHILERM